MSNPLLNGLRPIHPGEILREDIIPALQEAQGLSKSRIAEIIGISRQTLYAILREAEPVTPRTAVRLGHAFGNGPEFWATLQLNYDLKREEQMADLSDRPTFAVPG